MLGFRLVHSHASEFWVEEHAVRYQPASRCALTAVQVVPHYSEVVKRDVRELRAPGALAHCPYIRSSRLQSLVDLYICTLIQLDSSVL